MKYPKSIITGGFIAVLILLILPVLPFILHWKSHDPTTHVFKLGEYGSYLQGALTPVVVIIAFITVYIQMISLKSTLDAQRDANTSQRDANKRLLMGIMLDNIEKFQGHLNYLAFAAFYKKRRSRETMD